MILLFWRVEDMILLFRTVTCWGTKVFMDNTFIWGYNKNVGL